MSARTVGADRWELVLPPGWATIPTAAEPARDAVRRLLDRALRGKPRDELAPVRVELDQGLRRSAAQAAAAGITQLHVLVEPVRGVPVSASLGVAPMSVEDDGDLLAALRAVLGPAEGVQEHGRRTLGDLTSLRRRRRIPVQVEDGGPEPVWQTCVDYVVQLDAATVLVLSFTTLTDQVADALVAVFDAMAGTLRRREVTSS